MDVMIKIPVFLFVAQWALLAALGLLVVIMYRQLGRLLTSGGEAATLGPEVGSQAAALTYARAGDQRARQLTPGGGEPLLVAFADPTCPSCEQLVAALGELSAAGQLSALRTLVLISDPPSYLQISDVFSATELEVGRPVRREGLEDYRVSATPLLVAIDGAGVVRAAGTVVRAAEVLAFAQSCLLPVPAVATIPVSTATASTATASTATASTATASTATASTTIARGESPT
jgi:hypothetical protein